MRTIEWEGWDRLLEHFDGMTGMWALRGQRKESWRLRSSLEHCYSAGSETRAASDIEAALLSDFIRRAHLYVDDRVLSIDPIETLALMQHFGAPTRFIDFTASPFVATFFAIEDATPDPATRSECSSDDCAAVWAIDRVAIWAAVGPRARTTYPTLAIHPLNNDDGGWGIGFSHSWPALSSNAFPGVAALQSYRLSERANIQQGLFLCATDVNQSFEANLEAMKPELDDRIVKYLIPYHQRAYILEQLRKMNITRASLFPGLQGFAESLRTSLIREPPSMRALRRVFLDGRRDETKVQT